MNLLATLKDFCSQNKTVWVAFSGGMDSQVLLSLLLQLRQTTAFDLRAIHVHHNLSENADAWAKHCENYCLKHAIEYHEVRVNINLMNGDSLENAARNARLDAFKEKVQPGDILLTAHHQQDQAETLLLQLFRGAGIKGLAAMPAAKIRDGYLHARPLLNVPRSILLQYAQEQALSWVEDESNLNTHFARNFLRHNVLPVLQQQWPSVNDSIARSAQHCAEAQNLLEEFSQSLCTELQGSRACTLSVNKLLALDVQKQKLSLRSWIYKNGFSLPSSAKLETILRNVLTARRDRKPCVVWANAQVRRHKDDLYIQAPLAEHNKELELAWDFHEVDLVGIGKLTSRLVLGKGLALHVKNVTVRYRRGGEIAHLAKRKHHELKKLFQEWDVLPWQRDRIPLLFHEEKLIAATGYFVDPHYSAAEGEVGREIFLMN